MSARIWRQASGRDRSAFKAAMSRASQGEPRVECPVCRSGKLCAYYHLFDPAARLGTLWAWCQVCKTTGQLANVTPFPTVDMGLDPFAELDGARFRALETDLGEPFIDRLDRMWEAGTLGMERPPPRPYSPARWTEARSAPVQFAFMGAASRALEGERMVCPNCQRAKVRTYFHVFDESSRTGTIWVWCPSCRHYAHLYKVLAKADLGPDPFAGKRLTQGDDRLLTELDRLWNAGELGHER